MFTILASLLSAVSFIGQNERQSYYTRSRFFPHCEGERALELVLPAKTCAYIMSTAADCKEKNTRAISQFTAPLSLHPPHAAHIHATPASPGYE